MKNLALVFVIAALTRPASAGIIIDSFDTPLTTKVTASGTTNSPLSNWGVRVGSEALGGDRDVYVERAGTGATTVTKLAAAGTINDSISTVFEFSQLISGGNALARAGATVSSDLLIDWDGSSPATAPTSLLSTPGLGLNLNLSSLPGAAIQLDFAAIKTTNTANDSYSITLYDGTTSQQVTKTFADFVDGQYLTFSGFSAVDLSNIKAIRFHAHIEQSGVSSGASSSFRLNEVAAISAPEPASSLLFAFGGLALLGIKRRRK